MSQFDNDSLLTPAEVAVLPERVSESFVERLFSKVEIGDCWHWTGATNKGYGVIGRGVRGSGLIQAHRAVWMLLVGEIPEGWQLDHWCRNHGCVNPVRHSRRSECNHGHPLDGVTITKKSGAVRYCKECARRNSRSRYHQRKRASNGIGEVDDAR